MLGFDLITRHRRVLREPPGLLGKTSPSSGGDDALRDCDQHGPMCPCLALLQCYTTLSQQRGLGRRAKFHKGAKTTTAATPSASVLLPWPAWIREVAAQIFSVDYFDERSSQRCPTRVMAGPPFLLLWPSLLSEHIFLQPQKLSAIILVGGSKFNCFEQKNSIDFQSLHL